MTVPLNQKLRVQPETAFFHQRARDGEFELFLLIEKFLPQQGMKIT
jgi:hypothetical protein